MSERTDEDHRYATLMRQAQDGDASAYARLLADLTPLVRRMIGRRQRTLQSQDMEDLVQDILLSLHSARATYDPNRPFLPWLTAIVRNRMADGARRYGRRTANEVGVERYPETFSHTDTNKEEGYGDPDALRRAVHRLPNGQRKAVELLKLRELSLKEAALESGMSVGALKVAVHRGIKALRHVLKKAM